MERLSLNAEDKAKILSGNVKRLLRMPGVVAFSNTVNSTPS